MFKERSPRSISGLLPCAGRYLVVGWDHYKRLHPPGWWRNKSWSACVCHCNFSNKLTSLASRPINPDRCLQTIEWWLFWGVWWWPQRLQHEKRFSKNVLNKRDFCQWRFSIFFQTDFIRSQQNEVHSAPRWCAYTAQFSTEFRDACVFHWNKRKTLSGGNWRKTLATECTGHRANRRISALIRSERVTGITIN